MDYFTKIKNLLEDPAGYSLNKLKAEAESIELKDKKLVIDVSLRSRMLHFLSSDLLEESKSLLKMCVAAALANICSAQTPFVLFADLFNSKPISVCQELFSFMEETITTLKDVPLFDSGRNMLLRMCNDLLRRLSKTQDTEFCGQIQLFLSRLFPLDEKSGLNLMSNFNLEKETLFNKSPDPALFKHQNEGSSETLEEGELKKKASRVQVDANFYVKFWSIQDFFKVPTLCYEKNKWLSFQTCSESILDVFSSIKVKSGNDRDGGSHTMTFSKYLTSEKLLDLQLVDLRFRRYILVQFLILFQYLTTPNKFKTAEQVLKDDQLDWVNRKREMVLQLLSDGKKSRKSQSSDNFASAVERILEREKHWNQWKNEGCPSFVRPVEKTPLSPRKRRINALVDRSGKKIYRFGNRTLDKLWNVCPDNLEACRDEKRLFRPSMREYFQNALLEMDPAEKVEEQYKSINREEWTWRALRFLSRRSPHFFINWSKPGRPIKDYLTVILTEKMHLDEEVKSTPTGQSTSTSARERETDDSEPSPAKIPRLSEDQSTEQALSKVRKPRVAESVETQLSKRSSRKSPATANSISKDRTGSTPTKSDASTRVESEKMEHVGRIKSERSSGSTSKASDTQAQP